MVVCTDRDIERREYMNIFQRYLEGRKMRKKKQCFNNSNNCLHIPDEKKLLIEVVRSAIASLVWNKQFSIANIIIRIMVFCTLNVLNYYLFN